MGYYINPPNESKEAFLVREGELTDGPTWPIATHLPVCWVNNGTFTAAGIGWSAAEVAAFSAPGDRRSKQWYRVPRVKLAAVSDLPAKYTA